MTLTTRPLALLLLGACRSFDSVEDACKDDVRGDKEASEGAVQVFQRIGCYRRFAGLDRGGMDPALTEAVEAHTFYLERNGVPAEFTAEIAGNPGFTGVDAAARLEATEFLDDASDTFLWEVLGYVFDDRGAMVDQLMHDPFLRDILLAPGWEAGGYAEGSDPVIGDFFYANIALSFPSGARSSRSVPYPADGQAGVPISWQNPYAGDAALGGVPAVTGYPISFTVGSSDEGAGAVNPLGLFVSASKISGPAGSIEHVVVTPTNGPWGANQSTAILFPTQPLEPNASYTVDVTLSWNSQPSRDETVTFVTGAEGTQATGLARRSGPIR